MTTFTPTDIHYDYAIGGLPFLSAAGQRLSAYSAATLDRQTAPYRKDQTDQSNEVGEQSLSFWWQRSQSSFHGGAGQPFLDGGDTNPNRKLRFDYSRNVDVWTPGQVSLLPAMAAAHTDHAGSYACAAFGSGILFSGEHGGVYGMWYTDGATFTQVTGYTGTLGGGVTSDGGGIAFFETSTGVWKVSAGALGTPTNLYVSSYLNLYYVKRRLMALSGGSIYELDTSASAAALPAALYTDPDVSFHGMAEGPTGIYVGLDDRAIYQIGLTMVSGVPTLGAPTQVLELPGEESLAGDFSLYSYLGKFLALGTNKGVRIAKIASDGSLDVGPLTIERRADAGEYIFGGFASRDRFLYAVLVGVSEGQLSRSPSVLYREASAFRIDLSLEIDAGRYAWAQDFNTGDTDLFPVACCLDAAGKFWITGNSSLATDLYTSTSSRLTAGTFPSDAYLMTSRIRFSTGDDKVFERLQVSAEGTAGSISGIPFLNGDLASTYTTVALTSVSGTERSEARIPDSFSGKKTTHIQVKLSFAPADTFTTAQLMLLRGYVLKGLPAQKRQRTERIPLMCFDLEEDQNRQRRGELGSAFGRLKALEAMEEAGGVVTLQRFGEGFSSATDSSVVIDDIEFVQIGAPNKINGWGGVILLTVRTVD